MLFSPNYLHTSMTLSSSALTSQHVFPGKREPGEGERRPEEGGEAAHRGGQLPVVHSEQPRASVHRPDRSDPRSALPSPSKQLPPPAHCCSTLPALTRPTTEHMLRLTVKNYNLTVPIYLASAHLFCFLVVN